VIQGRAKVPWAHNDHRQDVPRSHLPGFSRNSQKISSANHSKKGGHVHLPQGYAFPPGDPATPAWSTAQTQYDLVIKGGEVIDPRSGVQAARDVAIRDHKIAAFEKDIPAAEAIKVINARGLLVPPGRAEHRGHGSRGSGGDGEAVS
jgi:hypothetical protein